MPRNISTYQRTQMVCSAGNTIARIIKMKTVLTSVVVAASSVCRCGIPRMLADKVPVANQNSDANKRPVAPQPKLVSGVCTYRFQAVYRLRIRPRFLILPLVLLTAVIIIGVMQPIAITQLSGNGSATALKTAKRRNAIPYMTIPRRRFTSLGLDFEISLLRCSANKFPSPLPLSLTLVWVSRE